MLAYSLALLLDPARSCPKGRVNPILLRLKNVIKRSISLLSWFRGSRSQPAIGANAQVSDVAYGHDVGIANDGRMSRLRHRGQDQRGS